MERRVDIHASISLAPESRQRQLQSRGSEPPTLITRQPLTAEQEGWQLTPRSSRSNLANMPDVNLGVGDGRKPCENASVAGRRREKEQEREKDQDKKEGATTGAGEEEIKDSPHNLTAVASKEDDWCK